MNKWIKEHINTLQQKALISTLYGGKIQKSCHSTKKSLATHPQKWSSLAPQADLQLNYNTDTLYDLTDIGWS